MWVDYTLARERRYELQVVKCTADNIQALT